MNKPTYGSQPIKNEQSGYHYTEPNRDSVDLQRILTAAKVSTVDELVDMFKCVREQTKPSVCVLDFLFKKGINSDTTIGIEGDYPITEILEEYANLQPKSHRPLSPEDIKRAAQAFSFLRDERDGFIAGANFAKQPHSNEWVKCCERLPKDFTSVLVSDGNTRTTALYKDGLFYPDFLLEHQEVKYWMPLPHPPKK